MTDYSLTKKACYLGYFVQAIVVNLCPLFFVVFQENFGISYGKLSALILISFLSQLVIDALSVRVIKLFGERRCIVVAGICCAVGLFMMGTGVALLPFKFPVLVVSTVIMAVGSGFIEVIISPVVDRIPSDSSSAQMSFLHSFYCIGQMAVIALTALFLALAGIDKWYLVPVIWAAVPIVDMLIFTVCPLPPEFDDEERIPMRTLVKSKNFILFAILMLCAGAAEQAVAQWASMFTEKTLNITKTLGDILGPCSFALFMTAGRILYGKFGSHIKISKALLYMSGLAVLSYIMITLTGAPAFALAGMMTCGFAVSIMWPGILGLSSETYKTGGTPMFALLALCGDLGCSVGPYVAGVASDIAVKTQINMPELKFGVLVAIIFPLVMTVCLLILRRKQK